jgi:hypothetical protein
MDYPEKADRSIDVASQGQLSEPQPHPCVALSSEETDAAQFCRDGPGDQGAQPANVVATPMADTPPVSNLPDTLPKAARDGSEAAGLLHGVAAELERAHRLSLDLQGVFSRCLVQMDARADLIRDAQDLDRLSQILENLARLLHLIAGSHPVAPLRFQVEECLTLKDLEARLSARTGRSPPASPERSDARQSEEPSAAIAGADHESAQNTGAEGDISWL